MESVIFFKLVWTELLPLCRCAVKVLGQLILWTWFCSVYLNLFHVFHQACCPNLLAIATAERKLMLSQKSCNNDIISIFEINLNLIGVSYHSYCLNLVIITLAEWELCCFIKVKWRSWRMRVLKLLLELWALHMACGYPSWPTVLNLTNLRSVIYGIAANSTLL